MPTRNIKLTDRYDQFVNEQVSAGKFSNASEVLRAGLMLLEQQTREDEEKLTALRLLAAEGFDQLDQGQGIRLKGDRQLERFVTGLGRSGSKRAKVRGNGR